MSEEKPRKKKHNQTSFTKGNKAAAGKSLPEDIKKAKALNQVELERILNKYLYDSKAYDLDEVLQDPNAKPIDQVIVRIILEAIEKGDPVRLDFLLQRLIGKVATKIEHSVPIPTVIERIEGGLVELGYIDPLEDE